MPSSTSSFERPRPSGNWGPTWLVALVIATTLTVSAEHAVRRRGQRPSVVDDAVSWAVARRSVDNDRRAVAFVGSSRMLLAYDAATFHESAPNLHGVQLAINAMPSIGVFKDLAADNSFRGVAVVDLVEWDIAAGGDPLGGAKEHLDRSHALWRAPGALANRWLAGIAQERVALLAIGGRQLVTSLARGKLPPPTVVAAARDRTSKGDYSLAPPGSLETRARNRLLNFNSPTPSPDVWLADAMRLEPLVAAIRERGGDVVFVRMPTTGRLEEGLDAHYPRSQYWDVFAARTSAHVIHFRDVEAMRTLSCPDEMHLDQTSQPQFTRALVDTLRSSGMFANR